MFAKILSDAGIVTTVRKTRGDDIDAACGQLAGAVKDRTKVGGRIERQRTISIIPVIHIAGESKLHSVSAAKEAH